MRRSGLSVVLLGLAAVSISGCSTTLEATKPDSSGHFSTGTVLDAGGVKAVKPFQEKYRAMAYVKIDESKGTKYGEFFLNSVKNMGVFTTVSTKADLEKMIIERKLTDKVSNVSDMIGLNNLQKQIGPFIVVEPNAEWRGGYDFVASIKVSDPESGETVLQVEQKAFNWAGLDKPLFYPLLNAFSEWTQGKTITTSSAATAPTPASH